MTSLERIIFLVSADPPLTQQLISHLLASGTHYQLPLAASVAQARKTFRRVNPLVTLLDESAVQPSEAGKERSSESLESAVTLLTEFAPVVVVAAAEHQAELAFLITSGAVDFVARTGNFLPVAVGLLERRVRLAEQAAHGEGLMGFLSAESVGDFGEILRHEVNNPLTGILGNAELLLAECKKKDGDRLPVEAIQRLQTIAALAVRLRETVRRLSNAWESQQHHARPA